MKDIKWMLRRMRAMSVSELFWRVREKLTTRQEKTEYYAKNLPVTEIPLPEELKKLRPDSSRLKIHWENENGTLFEGMRLFDCYEEREYRTRWNAGFQTENCWPEDVYSPELKIGQRTDIGDIRTNWELNRHYQFAMLAKSYYQSGDEAFLQEFKTLFEDWNQHNLFLHGAEWTSAMELAIRVNSWVYSWCFLEKAFAKWNHPKEESLLNALSQGILNMTDYIVRHRAHGSSANNHLVLELYAVGLVGIFFDFSTWKELSVENLTRELPRQNASDGVNREMSTHYQAFVMEAYGLLAWQLGKMPTGWEKPLEQMSRFLCDCCGSEGETIVFGDDDSGKILDLSCRKKNYYQYVLQLMGLLLPQRYTDAPLGETLCWLASAQEQEAYYKKMMYHSPLVSVRAEGGYSILRSRNQEILIAMDHAPLGFGSIAAHGHADALSIQVFWKGKSVLTDPGTWNYHLSVKLRDDFRSTAWHNTVCVGGENQSELLGPFLWGKRADTHLLDWKEQDGWVTVKAQTKYGTIVHTRLLRFDQERTLWVEDVLTGVGGAEAKQNFSLTPDAAVRIEETHCTVSCASGTLTLTAEQGGWKTAEYTYSPEYNHQQQAVQLCCVQQGADQLRYQTKITFSRK